MTVGDAALRQRRISALLIDLDDTLYTSREIPEIVKRNIIRYAVEKLKVPEDEVIALNKKLYQEHGTTMAGLVALGYKIDYDDWHAHVHHSLDYQKLLPCDPAMRRLLQASALPKWIFTNADRKHAEICLDKLGLADAFEGIVCFESVMEEARRQGLDTAATARVICKPNPLVFKLALDIAGLEAASTAFFDDSVRNVAAAKDAGIFSVLVGRRGAGSGADLEVGSLHEVPVALPHLWSAPSGREACREPPETERSSSGVGVRVEA